MTQSESEAVPAPRFRLLTFGTLTLVGTARDTVLGEHGHQRRRLALLAVLAAAGSRGRSRDQLLGVFWPDVSQSRARHSLEQLLYALRTSLEGPVFHGVNPLSLNTAFLESDIQEYFDALDRGERERAVELYTGPFLDGFYLDDAPEFQQWLDAERSRIEGTYVAALDALAKAAEDASDPARVVQWRQKLVDLDPVSSKHATALIHALVNAGEHASALKYAERHEALLAQELGTSAGPAFSALVAQVRERVRSAPSPASISPHLPVRARPIAKPAEHDEHDETVIPSLEVVDQPSSGMGSSTPASPRARPRRPAALYAAGALLLLFLGFTAWSARKSTDANAVTAPAQASVAVLPLVNLSGDPQDAALVDGLTEELITMLARIDGLRVVGRVSAFSFRGSTLGPRNIADSLNVSNLLEGGVQRVGQSLRVQLRLVDGRDGSTKWAETYDRELKDIFVVQSEIAGAVAQQLHLRLAPEAAAGNRPPPTRNIAAYELVLRGNDPALLRSDSTAAVALGYFQRAAALDSTYAAAFAGMARMYLRLRGSEQLNMSGPEKNELAREAAARAVALDASLADAQAALGLVLMAGGDFPGAEAALKRAVTLEPAHSRIREWLAFMYTLTDRHAEALAETVRAVENDPLSPSAHAEVGRVLCLNGQVADGLARLRTLERLEPPLARVSAYQALCHGIRGNWEAASEVLPRDTPRLGAALLGHVLARVGKKDSAQAILVDLKKQWERRRDGAHLIAIVYAGFGDHDNTIEWLNRSIDEGSVSAQMMTPSPLFADMKSDPRYEQFRRRLGIQKR